MRANHAKGWSTDFINFYITSVGLVQFFMAFALCRTEEIFTSFRCLQCFIALNMHICLCLFSYWRLLISDEFNRTVIRLLCALRSVQPMQLLFYEHWIYLRHVSCLFRPLLTTHQLKNFRNHSWILVLISIDDVCLFFTSTLWINWLSILAIQSFLCFVILLTLELFQWNFRHFDTCFVLLYDHALNICICLASILFWTLGL